MRSRDKSGRLFYPILQTAGFAGFFCRRSHTTAVPFSAKLYRRRHGVENFFQRIKRYRRVATRYDKLAETFLGFVCLAILLTR